MSAVVSCPDREVLRRLLLGQCDGPQGERLLQHLEQCDDCINLARTLRSDDPLTELARSSLHDKDELEESVVHLIDHLRRLGPPSGVDTSAATIVGKDLRATFAAEYGFLTAPHRPGEIGWLGNYRILEVLGSGGMGIVFRAEDTQLERPVALKVMRPELASRPKARDRFLREARAAAGLEHENIVTIYHVGEEAGIPFIAMQWLRGHSLEERLVRSAPLTALEVLRLGRQIARGLEAAHQRGLVHRDIKPSNIWLETPAPARSHNRPGCELLTGPVAATDGEGARVKILDFGLVFALTDEGHLTESGAVVGTPSYMAPEQVDHEAVSPRCDLFSLGVVLYRACTGRLPFEGSTPLAVLRAMAVESPRPIQELAPSVPDVLAGLIAQLLARNPADRPGSAQEVADRLAAIEQEVAGLADTAVRPPAVSLGIGRRGGRRGLLLAMAVLAVVLPLGWMYGGFVVRYATNKGELVVRVDSPDVEVSVTQNGAVVHERSTKREFILTAGKGEVEVHEKATGKKLATKQFTLTRGGKVTVTVELARTQPGEPKSGDTIRQVAEWVLSVGGHVQVRANDQVQQVRHARNLPAGPFRLVRIELSQNKRVSDADLRQLGGLDNLLELTLKGTLVTDAGMIHLVGLGKLKVLTLSQTRVGDVGLQHLSALKTLEAIKLADTPVGNAGLKHLSRLSRLQHLDLRRTRIDDAGLVHLRGLKHLQELNLHHTEIGDDGVRHLEGLSALIYLALSETRVGDGGLSRLGGLGRLRRLNLARTEVSDAGLDHLRKLTGLQVLDLTGTSVTAAAVANLKKALPGCTIHGGAKRK
jgi:hypothetical protein